MKQKILFLFFSILLSGSVLHAQHNLYGIWTKRAAFGSNGSASIITSTVDEHGNVYVAEVFSGNHNFSDDICNPVMRTSYSSPSISYQFVIKYDKNGKYQ
jgi:hypothetical protein